MQHATPELAVPWWMGAVATAALVLVHVFGGRLRLLQVVPRSRWLSFAGGMSIAYVFLHLLPELSGAQREIAGGGHGAPAEDGLLPWMRHHAYFVALLGLVTWYGLERMLRCGRADASGSSEEGEVPESVYRLHIAGFAAYNALVGYLIVHREQEGARGLAVFALAMALHFLVNDVALRREHQRDYHRHGRWLLAAAVAGGWVLGMALDVGATVTALLFALLAGSVILNVLKEELPEERASRFWPFVMGCAGYAALLLLAGG